MPERNSGSLSITDGRDQAAGSLSGFAGSESFAETTAVGPSRHIAPPQDLGRERGIAEVDEQPCVAEGDARDPTETLIHLHAEA